MPNQDEYQEILKKSWDKNWMTNRGDLVKKLETKIKSKFHIPYMIATTNGTLPIQIALKTLRLTGEIITTPFSYVATTSSIVWEGLTPVFVDIEVDTFTIDPKKIEKKITEKTSAILATHVFGNPCDVEAIEQLAKKYNLKVIYDAAHSFGVTYKDKSMFNYGDLSTCSFHATKIFHTAEGGAIFTKNEDLFNKLYYHHNFGHNGPEHFHGIGVNAKMSELQAAMGLTVWPYLETIFSRRKLLFELYQDLLATRMVFQSIREHTTYNYSYIPVVFESEEQLIKVQKVLNEHHIFPRRYFYPSLNKLPYLEYQQMPISETISERILCLPLYYDLNETQIGMICDLINKNLD
ncbi:DegT/DnrJ/EryC1/StrS family aminotransferase [Xanthomarina sp. F2636L]|uniref:DegT/DnrJ/EryC1/StrS family aminotransferase n=1 Tax=Xanthomarina sp. F2636L TaxID=2996018 RepID=UPI00225DF2BD|nr:DegT/DnrJ/EryC1/StrS family aminotransferase [Xanthomarina sp. F2636L]